MTPTIQNNWEEEFNRRFLKMDGFILNSLPALDPRDQKVIKMRFEQKLTLEEVAREFGVTRERIRQLETRAIERMNYYEQLKAFISSLLADQKKALLLSLDAEIRERMKVIANTPLSERKDSFSELAEVNKIISKALNEL